MKVSRRTFLQNTLVAGAAANRVATGQTAADHPRTQAAVILRGDFSDPTVLRDGDDFYMTHSNCDPYGPGLEIWHSRDLYHWSPVCRALRTPTFTWAADLVKHKGAYYIYYPMTERNFVITAPSIGGPWSDPVELKTNGIDPGHVVGPDGKRYLHLSEGTVVPLSDDGLSVAGKREKTYAGWPIPEDWNVEAFALESPKLLFHNGYYYLTSAQGGTSGPSTSHMVVSARSRSPLGPWENSPYNPIVHTYSPREKWCSRGHGSLVEGPRGRWYLIYHAIDRDCRGLGRQCLIEPVEWTRDGWFRSPYARAGVRFLPGTIPNYRIESDDFSSDRLKLQWAFCGIASERDWGVGGGLLRVTGKAGTLRAAHVRCAESYYEASASIACTNPEAEIGFIILYHSEKPIPAGMTITGGKIVKILRDKNWGPRFDAAGKSYLKIRQMGTDVMTFYGDGRTWVKYPHGMEVSGFHNNAFSGNSGWKIAAYIRGEGELQIRDFRYKSMETQP